MNGLDAVAAVNAQAGLAPVAAQTAASPPSTAGVESFGQLLARGLEQAESRIDRANELVRAFAIDDSVPIHEVTIALEEARIAVEFAMQVRARVVEGYREIMNMQL